MKIDWNRKYTTIAAYAVLTALAIMLLCVVFFNFPGITAAFAKLNSILSPIYIGLIIAYVANPIMKMSEKHIFRFKITSNSRFNLKRALSIAMSFLILIIIFTILILLIIPQVLLSLTDLASKLSGYFESTARWLAEFLPKDMLDGADLTLENLYKTITEYLDSSTISAELVNIAKQFNNISGNLETIISSSFSVIKDYVPIIIGYFAGLANGVLNMLLGIFFAIYMLASKEHLIAQAKKILRALSSEKTYNNLLALGNFTSNTFSSYLIGKVIDSLIVGIVMFVICAIFNIPYAILVSTLVAIFNVIPVIGPFIGAVPGVLIIFIVSPAKVLPFIIINIIIQQIDGNILTPKILGETTGLSSLWVLFSITVMGSIWGMTGMFIGVPIFAIIYMLIKQFVEKRLRNKDVPSETKDYYTDPELRQYSEPDENKESLMEKLRRSAKGIKPIFKNKKGKKK